MVKHCACTVHPLLAKTQDPEFHSIRTLREHVNRVHSSATTSLGPINCLYVMTEQCKHLKNHLATVHGYPPGMAISMRRGIE